MITPPTQPSPRATEFHAWLVCLAGSLFFFYESIQMSMFNAIDHVIGLEFNLSATNLSQLSSGFFIANVIFLIPAGLILDRYSTKKIILIMMLACTFGTALFSQTEHYEIAYVARFITGIGSAFCFLSTIKLAATWFPPQRLAFVTGLLVTVATLGSIVAQTPLTVLVQYQGWRFALLCDAILGLLFTLIILGYVQDKNRQQTIRNHAFQQMFRDIFSTYTRPHNIYCALFIALMNMPIALFGVIWGIPFLTHAYDLSITQASYITSLLFFGIIIGSPLFGWFSDHFQTRRIPMLCGAVAATIVSFTLLISGELSIPVVSTLFFFLGLVASSQVLGFPALAESNPPEITAIAVSIGSVAVQSGCAYFPTLYAQLLNYFSPSIPPASAPLAFLAETYHLAMILLPISFTMAMLIAFKIRDTAHA